MSFGNTLETDGTRIVVTSDDENSVYIFYFDGKTWNLETRLEPSDSIEDFGTDLAIDGDLIVIGNNDWWPPWGSKCYVYRYTESGWVEETQLQEDCLEYSRFSLDAEGDTIAVGCYDHLFVYEYTDGDWVGTSISVPPEYPTLQEGLTIHGDTIITGGRDWGDDGATEPFQHIFQRESLGWTHNGVIVPTIPTEFMGYLGRVFDLADNLFVVGTNTEDIGSPTLRTVLAFRRISGNWLQVAHLDMPEKYQNPNEPYPGNGYGLRIACNGERVVVGTCGNSAINKINAPVFVFDLSLDCNENSLIDSCEILNGELVDTDGDGVPDQCECESDINGDGYVNVTDLLTIIDQWGQTDSSADVNDDGIVDVSDLLIVIGSWGPCE
jgi:hypothetical protein